MVKRRFWLRKKPAIELGEGYWIFKHFLRLDPDTQLQERDGKTYLIINPCHLVPEGWEVEIPARVPEILLQTLDGEAHLILEGWEAEIQDRACVALLLETPRASSTCLDKSCFKVEHQGRTLKLDYYNNELYGLIIMECDFLSTGEAEAFVMPEWIQDAVDVTANEEYQDKIWQSSTPR